jgi:hypothetical protein
MGPLLVKQIHLKRIVRLLITRIDSCLSCSLYILAIKSEMKGLVLN